MAKTPTDSTKSGEAKALLNEASKTRASAPNLKEPVNSDGIAAQRSSPAAAREASSSALKQSLTNIERLSTGLLSRQARDVYAKEAQRSSPRSLAANNLEDKLRGFDLFGSKAKEIETFIKKTKLTSDSDIGKRAADAFLASERLAATVNIQAMLSAKLTASHATSSGVDGSQTTLSRILAFHMGPELAYMSSSLAAQHQQVVIQKAFLNQLESATNIVDAKLEAIKLNTSAPEIRKRSLVDMAREQVGRAVIEKISSRVGRKISDIAAPIFKDRVSDPLLKKGKEWIESGGKVASVVRSGRDAVVSARDEALRRANEARRDITTSGLPTVATGTKDRLSNLRDKFSETGDSARDRLSDVGSLASVRSKEALLRGEETVRGLRDKAKSILSKAHSASGDEDELVYEKTSLTDKLPGEFSGFRTEFTDYAGRMTTAADQIVEILGHMARQGVLTYNAGEAAPGSSSGGGRSWNPFKATIGGVFRGAGRVAAGFGRAYFSGAKVVGRMGIGVAKSILNMGRRKTEPFVDVYLKGNITLGRPLITKKRFLEGVVFADGEPVGDVADIDRPVIDPNTREILISEKDIEVGVVDPFGTPVSKRGATTGIVGRAASLTMGLGRVTGSVLNTFFSDKNPLFGMYATIFKSAASMMGSVTNIFGKGLAGAFGAGGAVGKGMIGLAKPFLEMYKGIFGFGLDAAKMGLRGAGKMIGRLFGFDSGGSGGLKRKDLHEIVGVQLEKIYDLLIDRFSFSGGSAGDADGDGDRDGSYADYMERMKERRKESALRKIGGIEGLDEDGASGAGGLAGILGGLTGLASSGRKQRDRAQDAADFNESVEEEDDDSLLGDAAAVGAAALAPTVGGRIWNTVKGAGKAVGKGAGRGVKGAGKGAWLAAKLGVKGASSVGRLVTRGATKFLGKSLLKKIPILGALAGAGFAAHRAIDGDWMGAAGELASGLVSLVPFVGTAASVGIDGWLLHRDMTSSPVSALLKARMKEYGVKYSEDASKHILVMEKELVNSLQGTGRFGISRDIVLSIMEDFGFDTEDKKQRDYFAMWINKRMAPIFGVFIDTLKSEGVSLEEIESLERAEVSKIITKFTSKASAISQKFTTFRPDIAVYKNVVLKDTTAFPEMDPSNVKDPISERGDPDAETDEEYRGRDGKMMSKKRGDRDRFKTPTSLQEPSKKPEGSSDLDVIRIRAYGLKTITEAQKHELIRTEKTLLSDRRFIRLVDGISSTMPFVYPHTLAGTFGIKRNERRARTHFGRWVSGRMCVVLASYIRIAEKYSAAYETVSLLDVEQQSLFATAFIADINSKMSDIGGIFPELGAREADVQLGSMDDILKEEAKASGDAPPGDEETKPQLGKGTPPTRPTPSVTIAGKALRDDKESPRSMPQSVVAAKALEDGPDMKNLGSLSAKHESSASGSLAIGYDRKGGTSYGKYQIASRTGTFRKFIKWLYGRGGTAAVVAKRLEAAGHANTGSRMGSVPDEWRRLVNEGLMGNLEHEFIKETHYDITMAKLSPELRDRIESSDTLKNVVWSTSVQHGPSGAAGIIVRAASQAGETRDDAFVRKLYDIRKTQFGSSPELKTSLLRRFSEERTTALANLVSEKASPVDDAEQESLIASADTGAPTSQSSLSTPKPGTSAAAPAGADKTPMSRATDSSPTKTLVSVPAVSAPLAAKLSETSSQISNKDTMRVSEIVAKVDGSEIKTALVEANSKSHLELAAIRKSLDDLGITMKGGLGEGGSIERLGKEMAKSNENVTTVVAPVIAATQNSEKSPNRQRGRTRKKSLKDIDMSLSRSGSDTEFN